MSATPDLRVRSEEAAKAPDAVNLCLLLGQMLFTFGATAQRIRDSVVCLARHLGCKVDMLVSYDALLVTINDGATCRTRIDSSPRFVGLNLIGLARVSAWLRELPFSQSSSSEYEYALCAIRDKPPAHGTVSLTVAAGCAGAAFCCVNGGDPLSWACCFAASAFIFALRRQLAAHKFNIHLTFFVIAFAGSLLSALIARITGSATPVIALEAPVLFLVPGVPMINGGIDIVRNHVTIGIARVGYTLAVLVDLCLGVGVALSILPSAISPPFSLPGGWNIMLASLAGGLAAGALACLNNSGVPMIALCAVGGLTGRLVRGLAAQGGLDLITASLIGVLSSTLVVGFIAERLRWPSVVVAVIAALPMVPGYFAIAGLTSLLRFAAANAADPAQLAAGIQALTRALFISVALVVGVIGPVVILQRGKERV